MSQLQTMGMIKLVFAAGILFTLGNPAALPNDSPRERRLSPVVFVPGNGGSQLEAKLDSALTAKSYGCQERKGWFRLWLNIWDLLLGRMSCWSEITRLFYDPATRSSSSPPGVTIRVPGFGDTDTVEFIDPTWLAWASGDLGRYASPLVEHMVKWGYRRRVSIRAAPYDFRIAPHHQMEYMNNLKQLIEETYRINGMTKVTLLGHSMGGLFMTYFLRLQNQAWKDEYISSVVTMNTPWLGTGVLLKVYTSGFTYGVESVDATLLQKVQTSQETAPLMFPRIGAWSHDEVILRTPAKNYTLQDRDQFFDDVGFPQATQMYADVNGPDYDLEHPGVDFHCVYSHGHDTPYSYVYDQDPINTQEHAEVIMSNGDGTVNIKSLQGCDVFSNMNAQLTTVTAYRGPNHAEIFKDKNFLKNLRNILRQES